jgi:hypothetical protein
MILTREIEKAVVALLFIINVFYCVDNIKKTP